MEFFVGQLLGHKAHGAAGEHAEFHEIAFFFGGVDGIGEQFFLRIKTQRIGHLFFDVINRAVQRSTRTLTRWVVVTRIEQLETGKNQFVERIF